MKLRKTPDAFIKKCDRLGLEVVGAAKFCPTTTSKLNLNADLISVEEALKLLNGALKALDTPGLDKDETLRLRTVIQGVRIYKELLADYIGYRAIEVKLFELEVTWLLRRLFLRLSSSALNVPCRSSLSCRL